MMKSFQKALLPILVLCFAESGCDEVTYSNAIEGMDSTAICGNGKIDDGEECDLGEGKNGADFWCNESCQINRSIRCDENRQNCIKLRCGNGKIDTGEECDLGEGNNGAEFWCNENCQINPLVTCDEFRENCTLIKCGNGIIEKDEECDLGDKNSDNAWCSSECKINSNVICDAKHENCKPIGCGNGVIEVGEECDEGNDNGNDVWCNSECKINPLVKCYDKEHKNCKTIGCGNGLIDTNEECDEGEGNNGAEFWCDETCHINTNVRCDKEHKNCIIIGCGNGLIDTNEECDEGEGNNGAEFWCDETCHINTNVRCDKEHKNCKAIGCGNGYIDADEECDDGIDNNGTEFWCDETCHINTTVRCDKEHKNCKTIGCGNGLIDDGEECDLGNGNNGEEAWCDDNCQINPNVRCNKDRKDCVKRYCGDGKLDHDFEEECDDGNNNAGDGCDPRCKVEQFFKCTGIVDDMSTCTPSCGDGVWLKELGEECDDGNNDNGDGCDSTCHIEDSYECINQEITLHDETHRFIMTTHRDFRNFWTVAEENNAEGTATQDFYDTLDDDECKDNGSRGFLVGHGHPDFRRVNTNNIQILNKYLSDNDKPVLSEDEQIKTREDRSWTCQKSFDMWFNDDSIFNQRYTQGITLINDNNTWIFKPNENFYNIEFIKEEKGKSYCSHNYLNDSNYSITSGVYQFDGNYFIKATNFERGYYPIIQTSLENTVCDTTNSEFTTEIHAFIKYVPSENNFLLSSDDDSWMFVNGQLFLDNGGVHATKEVTAQLTNTQLTVGNEADPKQINFNKDFQLYEGGIYPIAIFYAERGDGAAFEVNIPNLYFAQPSICHKKVE